MNKGYGDHCLHIGSFFIAGSEQWERSYTIGQTVLFVISDLQLLPFNKSLIFFFFFQITYFNYN